MKRDLMNFEMLAIVNQMTLSGDWQKMPVAERMSDADKIRMCKEFGVSINAADEFKAGDVEVGVWDGSFWWRMNANDIRVERYDGMYGSGICKKGHLTKDYSYIMYYYVNNYVTNKGMTAAKRKEGQNIQKDMDEKAKLFLFVNSGGEAYYAADYEDYDATLVAVYSKKDKLPKVKETNAMCIRALARAFDLRDTKTNKKVA